MAVNRERMVTQLLMHEGLRLRPYRDTVGLLTVGVGYCIDKRGIKPLESVIGRKFDGQLTRDEAVRVLESDIDRFEAGALKAFPFYAKLDEVRQRVCLDMAFNMGYGALAFKKTIGLVEKRRFLEAGDEMMKSKWSDDVGDGWGGEFDRAERLAVMMKTGKDWDK
jgi:lysozyme